MKQTAPIIVIATADAESNELTEDVKRLDYICVRLENNVKKISFPRAKFSPVKEFFKLLDVEMRETQSLDIQLIAHSFNKM